MTAIVCTAAATSIVYLFAGSVAALRKEGLAFFTTSHWLYRREQFGAASMLFGSAVVAVLALLLATPVAYALFDDVLVFSRRFRKPANTDDSGADEVMGPRSQPMGSAAEEEE